MLSSAAWRSYGLSNNFFARHLSTTIRHHDVVVIGGGMVGATQACLLAGKVGSVCLVDPGLSPNSVAPLSKFPDLRVSAISPGSAKILKNAGAWPPARNSEFRHMHVWDSDGGNISFAADEGSEAPLGYIVENRLLTSSLYQSLRERGVEIYNTEATSLGNILLTENARPQVTLKDGTVIGCNLVIGADGGRSVVRTHMAPPTTGWSYSQLGVVAAIQHPQHIKNTSAWQCFLPTGPIALLPLYENYSSIVWSTNVAHAEYLMALDDAAFVQQVQKAFAVFSPSSLSVPHIESVVGKKGAFPLRFEHSLSYVGNRIALVGDAAHTIHPLAGQGVNLGLGDAEGLATALVEAAESGFDIGSSQVLKGYESKQLLPNHAKMIALDALKGVFGAFPLLSPLRAAGLRTLNHMPMVKKWLVNIATGTALF